MNAVDDGGPAFPCVQEIEVPDFVDAVTGEIYSYRKENVASHGMSLRDHFAGLVLQGIYASRETYLALMSDRGLVNAYVYVSDEAYRAADAMIAARSRGAS